jgi:hypothetical protein
MVLGFSNKFTIEILKNRIDPKWCHAMRRHPGPKDHQDSLSTIWRCERAPHRLRPSFCVQVEVHRSPAHLLWNVPADGEWTSTAANQVQGCSAKKGALETPNHSVYPINHIASSPFLAEPPCTGHAATRRVGEETVETAGASLDAEDLRGMRPQGSTLWARVGGEA